jgi:hypothetical protein
VQLAARRGVRGISAIAAGMAHQGFAAAHAVAERGWRATYYVTGHRAH